MPADVLLVALGSTAGLRRSDSEFAGALARAGLRVAVAHSEPQRDVRTFMLTDLRWATAARDAARHAIEQHAPRAVVYSTTTAALLWPRPGAIRFDAVAAATRPGRHGLWQRPLERRRLRESPLLLPQDRTALDELGDDHAFDDRAVVVPITVEPSGPPAGIEHRDIAAITYAANPRKKGLDRVLAAWAQARRDDELLMVCGIDEIPQGYGDHAGVRCAGMLDAAAYRALLRRSRVYVTAPRREDHGVAQLEALADGCALVTSAAPGPYAALRIARAVDPRWVTGPDAGPAELAAALRTALDEPAADLGTRGPAAVLAEHGPAAVDDVIARAVIPRLLGD